MLLAIDPGPTQSGWLLYDESKPTQERLNIDYQGHDYNSELRAWMMANTDSYDDVAIEMVGSYESGKDLTETAVQIGMFQHLCLMIGKPFHRVFRDEAKLFLCGRTAGMKDKHVNEALRGYFNAPTLKNGSGGGCMKGFTGHVLAALAVAVTWHYHNRDGEAYVAR